ncbi:helix-turn-helix transcriptional regulator [Streptomyces hoynatensis]|uniref:DNA-binding protein n=1 Tax=Streptomyces hoynatensis TaxID=1141874 RepID=A0A3A9YFE8_9ACTN|nr:helix-turn-helix domain-containing protein [Streptomyces hoynatensis]RKN35920.1 DNA-binding protein [Streptomyces hoynatensis]
MQYGDEEPLTVPEVAAYLRLSRSRIYTLIQQEKIRTILMDGSRRVKFREVRRFVDSFQVTS